MANLSQKIEAEKENVERTLTNLENAMERSVKYTKLITFPLPKKFAIGAPKAHGLYF